MAAKSHWRPPAAASDFSSGGYITRGRCARGGDRGQMSGFVHAFEGLQKLQVVSDARAAQFDIHPRVICWKDKKERALYGGFMPTDETTVNGWLHTTRRGKQLIRVGLISSFVKMTTRMEEWGKKNWHVWLLMVIQRAMAVYDCNAYDFLPGTRWSKFNNGRAKTIVNEAVGTVPLFVSQPDEIENRDGICVQLTVESAEAGEGGARGPQGQDGNRRFHFHESVILFCCSYLSSRLLLYTLSTCLEENVNESGRFS
ncbi:hypothetical protein B0H11DRAFT_2307692 [Mycena galericulata]|nr:hypothetical protein B0H11DRAFT_2307692 [Mycena galericulata]